MTSIDTPIEAVMVNQSQPVHSLGKSRIAGLVLACTILAAMGICNLPFQFVETNSRWMGSVEISEGGNVRRFHGLPTMAGWPLRYSIQYDNDGMPDQRYWSTAKLVGNFCIAFCVAVFVYVYIQVKHWKTHGAANGRFTRAIFDGGTALGILMPPLIIVVWNYSVAYQHSRLASQLLRFGNCQMSCWFPEPIAKHVPGGVAQIFMRLREAHLLGPNQQILQRASRLPTLVTLYTYGGEYDASTIKPLTESHHFSALAMNRRNLDRDHVSVVAKLPWLIQLRLVQTNLDNAMMRDLDTLRHLKSVDLSRSNIVLADIGTPDWAATVEEFSVSRPINGSGGSLTVDGWPKLKQLSVSHLTRDMNEAILDVRLTNLPNLKTLRLDRNQKHRLFLRDLPRLARIDEGLANIQRILAYEDLIPGLTWASEMHIDGAASLSRVDCFARDLESLTVKNSNGLRSVSLGSYLVNSMGDSARQPADPEKCQEWIDKLGAGMGPGTVELMDLPLGDADLTPLAQNDRIRKLTLINSRVSFDQLQQLEGMEQMERLDISACRLEEDQLTWILEKFPKLEELTIDGSGLARFDLSKSRQLKKVRTTILEEATELRIVDFPSVETHITLARTPNVLEIRDARSLLGLAIREPWPKNAQVSGLRDLEWFAGGGEEIDDNLLDVLLECESLDQLTLAYTSISPEKAAEIGRLHALTLLAMPGSDIDDEVTANWHRLKTLWEVNFDDTSVSVETLAWLSSIESLRRLSLNRVALNEAASDALCEIRQVSELRLSGVPIEPQKLFGLLDGSNVESIDLSGQDVDDEFVDVICHAYNLKQLTLRNTPIDAKSLRRILDSNPGIYVELGDRPEFVDDKLAAELSERAKLVNANFNRGWRQSFLAPMNMTFDRETTANQRTEEPNISWAMRLRNGTINPQVFRQAAATQ